MGDDNEIAHTLTFLAGADQIDMQVNGISAETVMNMVCGMSGVDMNHVRSEAKKKGLCVVMHYCTVKDKHEQETDKRKMI